MTSGEIVQLLLAVIATATQLTLLLLKDYLDKRSMPTKDGEAPQSPQTEHRTAIESTALDLSLLLLCSAFFSVVLSDAIMVSGRSPGLGAIVGVMVISAISTAILLLARRRRRTEFGVGMMSAATLLLLLIAPGGAFVSRYDGNENGMHVFFPALVLVITSATSLLYLNPNPLSPKTRVRRRVAVLAGLTALALAGSIGSGFQFVQAVFADDATPKLASDSALAVYDQMQSNPDRALLYQLASELSLSASYRDYHQQVSGEIEERGDAGLVTRSGFETTAQELESRLLSPRTGQREREEVDRTVLVERERTGRRALLTLSVGHFASLTQDSQLTYLGSRLGWVHPVGHGSNQRAPIQLPGLSSDARYQRIGALRRLVVTLDSLNVRHLLGEDVPNGRRDTRASFEPSAERSAIEQSFTPDGPSSLFPLKVDPDRSLMQQLALRDGYERFLAYDEYRRVSVSLTKDAERRLLDGVFCVTSGTRSLVEVAACGSDAPGHMDTLASLARIARGTGAQKALDFSAIHGVDALLIDKFAGLLSDPEATTPTEVALSALVREIRERFGDQALCQRLADLVRAVPSSRALFQSNILEMVLDINKSVSRRGDFLARVADPVKTVAFELLARQSVGAKPISAFAALARDEQEAVLHQLAITFYRTGGPFSLDPLSLAIAQARPHGLAVANVCASALMFPLFAACVGAAIVFARKLSARDRLAEALAVEEARGDADIRPATQVETVVGREPTLERIRSLAGRGWTSIALVGRRGVGKTRVLAEVVGSGLRGSKAEAPRHVGVWITAPTEYNEEEFVGSVLEELAAKTERVLARMLGAKPLHSRRIAARATKIGLLMGGGGLAIVVSTFLIAKDHLHRPEVVIAWFPIAILVFASVACALVHVSRMQPVDLTSRLERDRSTDVEAVLLYRETREVFDRLERRRQSSAQASPSSMASRVGWIGLFALLFSISFWFLVISRAQSEGVFFLIITIGSAMGLLAIAFWTGQGTRARAEVGLMSLVSLYRTYTETLVHRIARGALGFKPTADDITVIVCIDEIDKIVDSAQARGFIRKIKAMFEVVGVFYFLSLAEDALHQMYLGAATGKNEIDSCFDHVVHLDPLTCGESQALARDYFSARSVGVNGRRTLEAVACASLGIPRDVFRACDEIIEIGSRQAQTARVASQKDGEHPPVAMLVSDPSTRATIAAVFPIELDGSAFLRGRRREQLRIAYEATLITRDAKVAMSGDAEEAARHAQGLDFAARETSAVARIALGTWVLALCEIAVNIVHMTDADVTSLCAELMEIGYRASSHTVSDIRAEVQVVHKKVMEAQVDRGAVDEAHVGS